MTSEPADAPDFALSHVNLADPRLGAAALAASDDFFAPKERMLNPEPAVFIPGKYDDNGKWMDGWESRRKRGEGYDWCVVRLGRQGVIRGVDIDTSHRATSREPRQMLPYTFLHRASIKHRCPYSTTERPTRHR